MTPTEILENSLLQAVRILDSKKEKKYPAIISSNVDVLINKIDKNKSLLSALVTSLVKKITEPKQDIRLHRTDFKGGYSARSLDTALTAPFFKKYFPKYATKNLRFLPLPQEKKLNGQRQQGRI